MFRTIVLIVAVLSAAACAQKAEAPKRNAVESPAEKQSTGAPSTSTAADKPAGQTVALEIGGMHCDGCVETVQGILEKLDGVESAEVSLETSSATVHMRPGKEFPEAAARDKLDVDDYKLKTAPRVIAAK